MRISSMKSVVATLSIAATLLVAAPIATARTTQSTRAAQAARYRDDSPISDRIAAIRQFINRTLRRIGINNGPSIPIPKDQEEAPTEEQTPEETQN